MLDDKYKMTTCLFETTSLYGSSKAVSQYDGMKPLIRFKGLTDSDFMPMLHGKTYSDLKDYVEDIGYLEYECYVDENFAIECLTEEYENMMEWNNTIKPTSLIKGSRATEIDNKPKPTSNYK